ncbi:MAG: hypothetical protein AAGL18_03090 [Pseudomonadota bacterium]
MDDTQPLDLDAFTAMLSDFLCHPGHHYDGLAGMVEAYDYELLDDHGEAATLIPVGELPNKDVAVCYSDFDQAPYLISTRAQGAVRQDPDRSVIIVNRRVPMLGVPERDLFEWTTDFFGADAAKADEEGGHAWLWTLAIKGAVIKDTVRLFVAKAENMIVLDRMAIAAA